MQASFQNKGHGRSVDWWSLGIVIFEMLVGVTPFCAEDPFSIYRNIVANDLKYPMLVEPVAKDLISNLLNSKPIERLGYGPNGVDSVKRHRWFRSVDWAQVINKSIAPPFVPSENNDVIISPRLFDEF